MDELSKDVGESGQTQLDLLVKAFVTKLHKQNKEAFNLFIKRVWPEVSKHQVTADVDLGAEILTAASELQDLISDGGDSS